MNYEKLKSYTDQYKDGIKKIIYRTSKPKSDDKKIYCTQLDLPNYALYFSNSGILLKSIHKKDPPTRVIYGNDNNKEIVCALELTFNKRELLEFSEFIYNENGRIEYELCRSFSFKYDFETYNNIEHTYKDNIEEIWNKTNESFREDECFYKLLHLDGNELLLEEKVQEKDGEIYYWNIYDYDNEGKLVKSISMEDGIANERPINIAPKYVYEDKFEYNEKGIWIKKTTMRNGEPFIYVERDIEYF